MAQVATRDRTSLAQVLNQYPIRGSEISSPYVAANTHHQDHPAYYGSSEQSRVDSGVGRISDATDSSITVPWPAYKQQTTVIYPSNLAGHQPQPYQESAEADMVSRHGSQGTRHVYQTTVESQPLATQYIRADDQDDEEGHGKWILIWLSFLNPLFCLLNAALTVVALAALLVCLPIRLFRRNFALSTPFIRTIAPMFRQHLKMIFAPSLDQAHTFQFSIPRLMLVNITSSIVSMGIALASWFTAAFWLFSIVMGNPDGTERKDDGKEAILSLRNWWERYLLSAVKR